MLDYKLNYRMQGCWTVDGTITALTVTSGLIRHVVRLHYGEDRTIYFGGSFYKHVPTPGFLTCDCREALDFSGEHKKYWEEYFYTLVDGSDFPLVPELGLVSFQDLEGHVIYLKLPLNDARPGHLRAWYVHPNKWSLDTRDARTFESKEQAARVINGEEPVVGEQKSIFNAMGLW